MLVTELLSVTVPGTLCPQGSNRFLSVTGVTAEVRQTAAGAAGSVSCIASATAVVYCAVLCCVVLWTVFDKVHSTMILAKGV